MKLKTRFYWNRMTWQGGSETPYPVAVVPIEAQIDITPVCGEDADQKFITFTATTLTVPVEKGNPLETVRKAVADYEKHLGEKIYMTYLQKFDKK